MLTHLHYNANIKDTSRLQNLHHWRQLIVIVGSQSGTQPAAKWVQFMDYISNMQTCLGKGKCKICSRSTGLRINQIFTAGRRFASSHIIAFVNLQLKLVQYLRHYENACRKIKITSYPTGICHTGPCEMMPFLFFCNCINVHKTASNRQQITKHPSDQWLMSPGSTPDHCITNDS